MHSNFHLCQLTCQSLQCPCADFHTHFFLKSGSLLSDLSLGYFYFSVKSQIIGYFYIHFYFPSLSIPPNQNELLLYSFDVFKPIWMVSCLKFYTLISPLLDPTSWGKKWSHTFLPPTSLLTVGHRNYTFC